MLAKQLTSEAPSNITSRLKHVGPGLIMAVTGVGVGDLVAALVAGTLYGHVFVWALIVAALLKYTVNEGIGRWYLATGQTILQGWNSLGKWATVYFGVYLLLLGFVYSAAVSSATALATTVLFPVLPLWCWAMIHAVFGFLLVWTGRFQLFERVMLVLVGIMFVTVVGSAVLVAPKLDKLFLGMIPRLPDGSLLYALGLMGGIGATVTLASYAYWLREKGWRGSSWIPTMKLDVKIAYAMTFIFTLSLLIIGMELLYGTGIVLEGAKGMIELSNIMGKELGEPVRWLFLVGFWSASFTSLLGAWNGMPYLFADCLRILKGVPEKEADSYLQETSRSYRSYLIWLTFPPMVLLFIEKPFLLVIIYGADRLVQGVLPRRVLRHLFHRPGRRFRSGVGDQRKGSDQSADQGDQRKGGGRLAQGKGAFNRAGVGSGNDGPGSFLPADRSLPFRRDPLSGGRQRPAPPLFLRLRHRGQRSPQHRQSPGRGPFPVRRGFPEAQPRVQRRGGGVGPPRLSAGLAGEQSADAVLTFSESVKPVISASFSGCSPEEIISEEIIWTKKTPQTLWRFLTNGDCLLPWVR